MQLKAESRKSAQWVSWVGGWDAKLRALRENGGRAVWSRMVDRLLKQVIRGACDGT